MTPSPLRMGEQVGNYVILGMLGRGGMGTVFRAENPHIGRQVAIKVLAPELAQQPRAAERFITEGRAVARIRHPNIIDIYDFGTTEAGLLYLVMEHLEGHDLGKLMEQRCPMSAEETLPYLVQIGGALQAAHAQGVVHRDLKPENIFILEGEPLTLKVFDFGLAKLLEDARPTQAMTGVGMVMGTPLTMAPEQAAGDHHRVGPGTDIYALGVILYWMLSGAPPFHDEPVPVLLSRHILEPPPPLRKKQPSLSEAIGVIVDRCLAKEPEARPARAWDVVEAFARALGMEVPRPAPTQPRSIPPVASPLQGKAIEVGLEKMGRLPQLAAETLPLPITAGNVTFPASAELEPTAAGQPMPAGPSSTPSSSTPSTDRVSISTAPSTDRVSISTTLSGSTGEIVRRPRTPRHLAVVVAIGAGALAIGGAALLIARGPGRSQPLVATQAARPDSQAPPADRPPLDGSVLRPDLDSRPSTKSEARPVAARPERRVNPVASPGKKPRPAKRPAIEKNARPEPKKTLGDAPPEF